MKRVILFMLISVFTVSMLLVGVSCKAPEEVVEEKAPAVEEAEDTVSAEEVKEEAAKESAVQYYFAYVAHGTGVATWAPLIKGLTDWEAEHPNVKVTFTGPVKTDATEQIEIINSLVESGVDGIVLCAANIDALIPVIDDLVDEGFPVLMTDQDAPGSKRTAFIGGDADRAGYEGGKYMAQLFGNKEGKVAPVTCVPGLGGLERKMSEFTRAMSELAPQVEVVSPPFESALSIEEGYNVAQNLLMSYPDIKGYYLSCGCDTESFGLAVRDAGLSGEIYLVGSDLHPATIELIRDGTVQLSNFFDFYRQGVMGMDLLYDIVVNEKMPEKDFYDIGEYVVTKDNIDEMAARK